MKFSSKALLVVATASQALAVNDGATGTLSSLDGGLGGTVTVINSTALMITHYALKDASAPALYWWGATDSNLPGGFRINNERVTMPASTDSIVIPLDAGKTAADFSTVGLWCEQLHANFGQAALSGGSGNTAGTTPSSTTGGANAGTNTAAASPSASTGAAVVQRDIAAAAGGVILAAGIAVMNLL